MVFEVFMNAIKSINPINLDLNNYSYLEICGTLISQGKGI